MCEDLKKPYPVHNDQQVFFTPCVRCYKNPSYRKTKQDISKMRPCMLVTKQSKLFSFPEGYILKYAADAGYLYLHYREIIPPTPYNKNFIDDDEKELPL